MTARTTLTTNSMCGRYTIVKKPEALASTLEVDLPELTPRFNVAPSQMAPVIYLEDQTVAAADFKWGLVPFWAKDEKIGYKMINARSETVREKPAFRHAYKKKRCLVLADGFYEWKRSGQVKVPYRIILKSEEPFAFAGLWESWTRKEGANAGQELRTFTILTTSANPFVSNIHDRMPVILHDADCPRWLDPQAHPDALQELLVPFDSSLMQAYPVSTDVNNPRHAGQELIQPVGARL